METLMLLTYTAICVVVFKVFKIPLNKWTVPTAILGGVILIGGTVLLMNYNHPYTDIARTAVVTTPIVPLVKGRVIEVPVKPNTPLEKGDVLFRIDPTEFQAEVDAQKAALAQAEQDVKIMEANWSQAKAQLESVKSIRDRTKGTYDRYATANENARQKGSPLPFSVASVQNRKDSYLADEAKVTAAQATERSARLEFESVISGENTKVAEIKAKLASAQFDLEQTVMLAPTDGLVTQMLLREGMIAVPMPLRPTMVFVHKSEYFLIGSFVQNSLTRVKPGNEAEVVFPSIPGHVFKGKVDLIQPVLAQGELQASGRLIELGDVSRSRVLVRISLDEGMIGLGLPAGMSATIAVYNDDSWLIDHIAIIRKILLRMSSWQNYVFGPIH